VGGVLGDEGVPLEGGLGYWRPTADPALSAAHFRSLPRFDAQLAPSPEWEPFGSFCFLLPQLEYLEAADCGLLSLSIAWDGRYASDADALGAVGEGPADAASAAARAAAVLSSLAPPAPPSSPAPATAAGPPEHSPSEADWGGVARGALDVLRSDDAARYRPPFGLAALDPELAKQEFISGGQQGLDDLLEALAGSRGAGSQGGRDGGAAAPAAAGGGAGPADAAASAAGSSGSGGGSLDEEEPIIKLVLARRTAWPLARRMESVALLEALQERDPRAYQLFLSVPGMCGSVAEQQGGLARLHEAAWSYWQLRGHICQAAAVCKHQVMR
jgi:hypothetical protein